MKGPFAALGPITTTRRFAFPDRTEDTFADKGAAVCLQEAQLVAERADIVEYDTQAKSEGQGSGRNVSAE